MTGLRAPVAMAATLSLALVLAGCGSSPPPLKNIPAPLPQNIPLEPPPPPPPPEKITASKGEDLWHLRSALNVAALLCPVSETPRLIERYNTMLTTHNALLSSAAQIELDQFKLKGGDWQGAYDTHMTRVYNLYSLTQQRPGFCEMADKMLGQIAPLSTDQFADSATVMLLNLGKSAGVDDAVTLLPPPAPIVQPPPVVRPKAKAPVRKTAAKSAPKATAKPAPKPAAKPAAKKPR